MNFVFRSTFQSSFQTMSDVRVAFASPISGGLQAGKSIIVQGDFLSHFDCFVVNLRCGESKGDDIALHLKVGADGLILNACENGSWGAEKKTQLGLEKKSSFGLMLVVNSENYQIYWNGCEMAQFQHRVPLERVTSLSVEGDVSLTNVMLALTMENWRSASMAKSVRFLESSQWGQSQDTLMYPVQNPTLPYVGPITNGLKANMALYFEGRVLPDGDFFAINLKTGQSDQDDIALHFNPRLGSYVALNSCKNGGWGTEESMKDNPFRRGETFRIIMVARQEGYQIFVNGEEHNLFKHRIPLENVSALNILGKVDMKLFGFIQNWQEYSTTKQITRTVRHVDMSGFSTSAQQSELMSPVQNATLPYVGPITNGLKANMALYFEGRVLPDGDFFAINLKTGQSDQDDIALHFNPRLGSYVALNSCKNGGWGTEESMKDNPFRRGETFRIIMVARQEGYQIFVNGEDDNLFKHRIPLENVSALNILGKVDMKLFGFIQNWQEYSTTKQITRTVRHVDMSGFSTSAQQSELMSPVQNATLPYVGPIANGLKANMALYFEGRVLPDGDFFAINLKTGQSDQDDIAFQFNPRLGSYVALNSCKNGGWGTEERLKDNPFRRGETFRIIMVARQEGYQIFVNGEDDNLFKHRIPLENVSALNILGKVDMKLFGFIQNWQEHSSTKQITRTVHHVDMSGFSTSAQQSELMSPVQNATLPYVGPITNGLKANMALYFEGRVLPDGDFFAINLKTGQSDQDDIAFQFNPRLGSYVALNSCKNGGWGTEERLKDNPFRRGETFRIIMVARQEGYQIFVNGEDDNLFKHRIPLENVSALNILGKVDMKLFGFIQNWQEHSSTKQITRTVHHVDMSGFSTSAQQSELMSPVQNATLPYVGPIANGLKANMALYFEGRVLPDGDFFAINLKTGQSDQDDIAFQFNPRLGSYVALNSCKNGGWGTEERLKDNPFRRGETFRIIMVARQEGYQIFVNGEDDNLFKHRIPLENVSALNILGKVDMKLFGFIQNWQEHSSTKQITRTVHHVDMSGFSTSAQQSELMSPVQNATLPYVGPITNGLKANMALYFEGRVLPDGDFFAINLKTGQSDQDDIAFQFNPRLGSYVALNSCKNGGWGTEERLKDNPFRRGETFRIIMVARQEGYQIFVNGEDDNLFKHRIPLENVSALNILGKVDMKLFGFIQNWQEHSSTKQITRTVHHVDMSGFSTSAQQSELMSPVQNATLPYVGPITNGLKANMALYFEGRVLPDGDFFAINLKTGQSDQDDIAFQFNPRLGSYVALNSCKNGGWGTEERLKDNPFRRGETFRIIMVARQEGYQIFVNGEEHNLFKHRIPLENVSALNILGKVDMKLFGFIQNWTTKQITRTVHHVDMSGFSTSELMSPVQNATLPYVGPITNGLKANMALYFEGRVLPDGDLVEQLLLHIERSLLEGLGRLSQSMSHQESSQRKSQDTLERIGLKAGLNKLRFAINLKTGQSDQDDIALHFNPRLGSKVTLNSCKNGGWGTEESMKDNPFRRGETFRIIMVARQEGYQIFVNGEDDNLFKHRIPLENVSALNILGKVDMKLFGFIQNWQEHSSTKQITRTVHHVDMSGFSTSAQQSELMSPVQNATLPYVGPIANGLKANMALYFEGRVLPDGDFFAINLKTGQSDQDDIAFQFNPRLGSYVALNSCKNGGWGTEERLKDNPFRRGETFRIIMVARQEGYQIFVNGEEHNLFKHRIPLENVSALNILGKVDMKLFGFIQNWTTKQITRTVHHVDMSGFSTSELMSPVQNATLPYVGPITNGLKANMALYFEGRVLPDGDFFAINLKTGQSDQDDIALHFNPRLGSKVTLNSCKNGGWGTEESMKDNPFRRGETFRIIMVARQEGYQIFVNGEDDNLFKHRIPLENVSALNILGKVDMKLFGFIQNWQEHSSTKQITRTVHHVDMSGFSTSAQQSELMSPVQNATLPYVGPITNGLKANMALYFEGRVLPDGDFFAINLKTGQSDQDDIAFQFNPRLGSYVALNSCKNGGWGTEERLKDNPFRRGETFRIIIVARQEGYQIFVNGEDDNLFKHRIPLENVSALNILGKVDMKLFGFIQNWQEYSTTKQITRTVHHVDMSGFSTSAQQSELMSPVQNATLPYVGPITNGLKANMALYFEGRVLPDGDFFAINLKTGQSDQDDIAFQFNPRLGSYVALNSCKNGGWGTEERLKDNPFRRGETFRIIMVARQEGYQIFVNGEDDNLFKHRIPLENVSALNILGKVDMKLFGFIQNWSSTSIIRTMRQHTGQGFSQYGFSSKQMLHPVQNPKIPYNGPIPEGLKEDMALFMQGILLSNAESFAVNFKSGDSPQDDTIFHLKCHAGSRLVVNSCRQGKWDSEETLQDNPFKTGEAFQMLIITRSEGFQIVVNGAELHLFRHRAPLENVKGLNVNGSVSVSLLGFVTKWSSSSSQSTTVTESLKSEVLLQVQKPTLPYDGAIAGGLRAGMIVCLKALVPTDAHQFSVNFKTGVSERDDYAFHFNPRLGSHVVMNSSSAGHWGNEDNVYDNPFRKGEAFEMFIMVTSEGFKVQMKGKTFSSFKHRTDLGKVTVLNIQGDVIVTSITLTMGV